MSYSRFLVLAILFFAPLVSGQTTDVIVVANTTDKQMSLTKNDVRNLFMGGLSRYKLEPVTLPPTTPARVVFNTKVIGLTEARIQSYWAQMRFSGRSQPPKSIDGIDELLEHVSSTPNGVTYLPAGTELPESLVIIYSTE